MCRTPLTGMLWMVCNDIHDHSHQASVVSNQQSSQRYPRPHRIWPYPQTRLRVFWLGWSQPALVPLPSSLPSRTGRNGGVWANRRETHPILPPPHPTARCAHVCPPRFASRRPPARCACVARPPTRSPLSTSALRSRRTPDSRRSGDATGRPPLRAGGAEERRRPRAVTANDRSPRLLDRVTGESQGGATSAGRGE